jgi:hypothetical protein
VCRTRVIQRLVYAGPPERPAAGSSIEPPAPAWYLRRMSGLAFDTHAFIKRLTAAGMPEAQAEVLADQQSRLIDEKLATKMDLAETGRALKDDLAKTEAVLKTDLAKTEAALRADLAKIEAALKADLSKIEAALRSELMRLDTKIEASKSDIIKWMFGTIGFQTLIIIGAVIALARLFHP